MSTDALDADSAGAERYRQTAQSAECGALHVDRVVSSTCACTPRPSSDAIASATLSDAGSANCAAAKSIVRKRGQRPGRIISPKGKQRLPRRQIIMLPDHRRDDTSHASGARRSAELAQCAQSVRYYSSCGA